MRPFCIFSYRISANILTHRVSLSHLTVSGASHFPHTPLPSHLHDNFSAHLSVWPSIGSAVLPLLQLLPVVALLASLCLSASSWVWCQLCSALVCWQSLYSTQKVSHFIFEPDLCLDPYFLDACSIFPFMSWVITSQSTCPELSLSSSFPHPQGSEGSISFFSSFSPRIFWLNWTAPLIRHPSCLTYT